MHSHRQIILNVLKQLLSVYLLYTICRILFILFNNPYFQNINIEDLFKLLFYGLRFDTFSITATNSLYILLAILPFHFYYSKKYQVILKSVFLIPNAFFIMLNFIDIAYFPYTQKRSTVEIFNLMFGKQIDLIKLIPHFILDYWYLLLIYFVFLWALLKSYEIINTRQIPKLKKINIKNISIHFLILISFCSYVVLGIRGGFQKIPIVLLDAAKYTRPNFIPILLNTPFSILKSTELHELKTSNLIPKNLSEKYFSPIHEVKSGKFENLNVCVIILESFSKEFCGIGGRKSYTPFLDSLMEKSLVFTNAYSNGKSSIEGVPAILASLPSLMQDPYINSAYSNNTIQTLPNLLKAKGYHTSFFHGGTNGTMNFDSFAKIAGFDYYYGRTEYNNERDYDGQWGIWDDAFLAQMPKIVSQFKEPFFTSLFTLSSHNPYLVPYKFKGKFPKGNLEIIETIGYTDYSLKLFFNEAKKEKWFNNTLFVITSDHTAISNDKYYSNPIGQYSIPIVFYKNNELIGTNGKTVQQIDILPTIMDYLNYDKPYYAFGESMFSARNKPIIYFTNPYYYLILDSTVYIGIEGRLTEAYNFKTDSLLKKSILGENKNMDIEMASYFKSFLQKYSNDILENKTFYNDRTNNNLVHNN